MEQALLAIMTVAELPAVAEGRRPQGPDDPNSAFLTYPYLPY